MLVVTLEFRDKMMTECRADSVEDLMSVVACMDCFTFLFWKFFASTCTRKAFLNCMKECKVK